MTTEARHALIQRYTGRLCLQRGLTEEIRVAALLEELVREAQEHALQEAEAALLAERDRLAAGPDFLRKPGYLAGFVDGAAVMRRLAREGSGD